MSAEDENVPDVVGVQSRVFLKIPPKAGSLIDFRNPQNTQELPYYHGILGSNDAESILINRGDFLIRKDPPDNSLVLSFRSTQDRGVIHMALKLDSDGRLDLPPSEAPGGLRYQQANSVEEFICYFYVYKVPLMDCFLLNPVSKP